MAFQQLTYQIAKSTIHAMPSWLLRLRPFEIYALDLDSDSPKAQAAADERPPAKPKDIRWLNSADELPKLSSIAAAVNLHNWNGTTRRAIVAWHRTDGSEQPVGIAWINQQSFGEPDLGISFQLHPNETWLHSAHVAPDCRRLGVYQAILRFAKTELKSEGGTRILLGVAKRNESSKQAHLKANALKLGSILAIRCLGLSLCLNRGKVQPKGIRIGKAIELMICK